MVAVLVTGCSAKFQEGNFLEAGYTNNRINEDTFEVGYRQGLFTSELNPAERDRVMMLRAAQIARQNGYTYFVKMETFGFPTAEAPVRIRCYRDRAPEGAYNVDKILKYNSNMVERAPKRTKVGSRSRRMN